MTTQVQLVTIEGNIGTGKTTIAKHVAKYMPNMHFIGSPSPADNPHWAPFKASPADHAWPMQRHFLLERLRTYLAVRTRAHIPLRACPRRARTAWRTLPRRART